MSKNSFDWSGLAGQVCVITGAAGGIGRETVRTFAEAGARLVLLDREQGALDEMAVPLAEAGVEVLSVACDIIDPDSIAAAAVRSLERFGPCRALVNCAAILRPAPLLDVEALSLDATFAVNVHGALYVSQAFGRQMIAARAGAIVHIASIAGPYPAPNSGPYSASKAAVIALTKQLALEWAAFGVRCNAICPGMIRTAMSERYYSNEDFRRKRDAVVPLGRVGHGSDIADVALFLCSDKSRYITAQELVVDGGLVQALWAAIPRHE